VDKFLEKAKMYIGIEATSRQDGRARAISQSPALLDVISEMPKLAKAEKGERGTGDTVPTHSRPKYQI
jgi:hypothetical protein